MCEFCSYKNNPFIIYGKRGHSATGYFDINYCPICGRKLVEDD
nr:MAG TPA: Rad50 zinc hook motif [Bacteriophage sp.]